MWSSTSNALRRGITTSQIIRSKDLLFKHFECAYTVIRLVYLITLLAQQVSDELPTAKFVVNHKDCLWHSFPCSRSEDIRAIACLIA